ncbi:MAG: CAP domain-containing protein [bacterium]|nr:CAP domain-containing protein [bacterium]
MEEPTNNHYGRQHVGRWELPIAALTVALFIELVFLAQVFFIIPAKFFAAILPGVIVDATNAERGNEVFGTLAVNPLLQGAAQKKADDMAAKGYFAHTAPDGTAPWAWFKQAGYAYAYAGENLAVNFMDSKDVVDAWMRSPSHRANIMNGHYSEIGIGVAEGEYQGQRAVYVVQFFGLPAVALAKAGKPAAITPPASVPAPAPTPTPIVVVPALAPEVAAAQTEMSKPKPARVKAVPPPALVAPSAPAQAVDTSFVAVPGTPETAPVVPAVVETSSGRESTVVGQLLASPRATANVLLLVLMTALGAALLMATATMEHVHLPHALAGATLALLVVVSFLALNHAVVLAAVQVR